jgi:hypothetical protein
MNGFAVVSEGVTDFAVLKNILIGWFKDQGVEPFLKQVQPDPTSTGESAWGNWENVLRFLRDGKYQGALDYADYLIVQIDTDQSEHPNFGVPQREGERQLDPHEMVERVAARLRELIAPDDLAFYQNRILFAICVREIECWLLPLWDESKAGKSEGCMNAVNRALGKADEATLDTRPKDSRRYDNASRGYLKRQILLSKGPLNPSLGVFLGKLKSGNFVLSSE